jgi:hypothetical protein
MPKVIVPADPVARAVSYLSQFVPFEAGPFPDVPAKWKWDSLLVVVVDTGGAGSRGVVLDDCRLTVEVSHPDSVEASRVCREIHGLLRAWGEIETGVQFLRTIQRPTYDADDETRTPAYTTTVELTFRANEINVKPIS